MVPSNTYTPSGFRSREYVYSIHPYINVTDILFHYYDNHSGLWNDSNPSNQIAFIQYRGLNVSLTGLFFRFRIYHQILAMGIGRREDIILAMWMRMCENYTIWHIMIFSSFFFFPLALFSAFGKKMFDVLLLLSSMHRFWIKNMHFENRMDHMDGHTS